MAPNDVVVDEAGGLQDWGGQATPRRAPSRPAPPHACRGATKSDFIRHAVAETARCPTFFTTTRISWCLGVGCMPVVGFRGVSVPNDAVTSDVVVSR